MDPVARVIGEDMLTSAEDTTRIGARIALHR
jgi:hypothetical protein